MVRRLLLAVAVLTGAFAPGWAAPSAQPAGSDHPYALDSARGLAPAPASAVLRTGRSRQTPRCTTTADRGCIGGRWLATARSSATAASFSPSLEQAAPRLVRRRGPPLSTSA